MPKGRPASADEIGHPANARLARVLHAVVVGVAPHEVADHRLVRRHIAKIHIQIGFAGGQVDQAARVGGAGRFRQAPEGPGRVLSFTSTT